MIVEKIQIVVREKGTVKDWKQFGVFSISTVEQAKAEIRRRSNLLDKLFDFAIRVSTLEEFSERN